MLNINTNNASLIAQGSLTNSTNLLNKAIERLTTGFKINHAVDNAANYSIVTNMSTRIGSYAVAEENANTALDLVSTASSSLEQMGDHLSRLRNLATQASNGTYGEESLEAINREANAIIDEINRLYNTTEFNGIALFKTAHTAGANAVTRLANSAKISVYSAPEAQSNAASGLKTSGSGFIKEITRRDTSGMIPLSSADADTVLSGGTYSISTAEELVKLAEITSNISDPNALPSIKVEFVLANDIDLSGYSNWTPINLINATFDGNGYSVTNLSVTNSSYAGFIGVAIGATVKNLAIVDAVITADSQMSGVLISSVSGMPDASGNYNSVLTEIDNCYVSGAISSATDSVSAGGLIGMSGMADVKVSNTITNVDILSYGESYAGGIIGMVYMGESISIDNTYSLGNIAAENVAGGIIGMSQQVSFPGEKKPFKLSITNSVSSGTLSGKYCGGISAGIFKQNGNANLNISNSYYNTELNSGLEGISSNVFPGSQPSMTITNADTKNVTGKTTSELNTMIPALIPPVNGNSGGGGSDSGNQGGGTGGGISPITPAPDSIVFQVGITSDWSSQIGVRTSFELTGLEELRTLGLDNQDYLSKIDKLLSVITAKQTELGAVENRLMSVLEEISIHYDNLVSSRSTLRDADIAEVSSEYIRQQILQQASATLLSTANQTPAIALQLI